MTKVHNNPLASSATHIWQAPAPMKETSYFKSDESISMSSEETKNSNNELIPLERVETKILNNEFKLNCIEPHLADIEKCIKFLFSKKSEAQQTRFSQVEANLNAIHGYVEFLILDKPRSYLLYGTTGTSKLIKPYNFYLRININDIFHILDTSKRHDFISTLDVYWLVSDSRSTEKSRLSKEKSDFFVSKHIFQQKTVKKQEDYLHQDGFWCALILDRHGNQKKVYFSNYYGRSIDKYFNEEKILKHYYNDEKFFKFIKALLSAIKQQNLIRPVFDVKLNNILIYGNHIRLIDYYTKTYTKKALLFSQEQLSEMISVFSLKTEIKEKKSSKFLFSFTEAHQKEFLIQNIITIFIKLFNKYYEVVKKEEALELSHILFYLTQEEILVLMPCSKDDFVKYLTENTPLIRKYFQDFISLCSKN